MKLFFTSDEHYGHSNRNGGIIFMCDRPYQSLEQMREDFIARHNSKVPDAEDSFTIHVGDMFWKHLTTSECCEIVYRLNGRHAYINGNHEEVFNRPDSSKLRAMFVDIAEVRLLKVDKQLVWISHYSHRTWPKSHTGSYHIFGHSHGVLPGHRRSMDVGVDANNYTPVSFEELDAKMKALGKLPPDEIETAMSFYLWQPDGIFWYGLLLIVSGFSLRSSVSWFF